MKYDSGYSIDELKPDVVVKMWLDEDTMQKYRENVYQKVYLKKSSFWYKWYFRKDSKNILWDQIGKYK